MEEYKNMADITDNITKIFIKEDTNVEENNKTTNGEVVKQILTSETTQESTNNPAQKLWSSPLEMVQNLMQSLGVKVTDFPEYRQMTASRDEKNTQWQTALADFNKLIYLVKEVFWQKIFDLMDEEAYDWAEKNIPETWRNELEIYRLKYKIVRVTATADIVLPDDVSKNDWSDYCDIDSFSYNVECMEESMTKDQVMRSSYDTINDVDDLD